MYQNLTKAFVGEREIYWVYIIITCSARLPRLLVLMPSSVIPIIQNQNYVSNTFSDIISFYQKIDIKL